VLLLTDPDVDVLAYQFLDSDYAADAYINWPLERRLEGFLRHRGMARIADDGDTCQILLDCVMGHINVVPATRVKAKTS
jgi:hypothetical protein